jgi:hypothetical protein
MVRMSAKRKNQDVSLASLLVTLGTMAWEVFQAVWNAVQFLCSHRKAIARWARWVYWIVIVADASGIGIAKVLYVVLTDVMDEAHGLTEEFVRKVVRELAQIVSIYQPILTGKQAASASANNAVRIFRQRVQREIRLEAKTA